MNIKIIVKCQPHLFQIVLAMQSTSSFSRLLNRRKQQADKNSVIAITTSSSINVNPGTFF